MSAGDATRVQEARRRLASFPTDAELAKMPAVELVTWVVRMQGAAQLLDAYVREAEADDAQSLREIRGLLARFDWEHDDRQLALEAIERIADGGEDQADEPDDLDDEDDEDEPYCRTCGAHVGIFIGHGGAWLHYVGEGTPENPVELKDAGHAPEVAWRPARGQKEDER